MQIYFPCLFSCFLFWIAPCWCLRHCVCHTCCHQQVCRYIYICCLTIENIFLTYVGSRTSFFSSVCLSGTSYTLTTYKRTPTQDGLPPLVFNTLVTGYYASQSDCTTSGVAPVVITAIPVGNTGGIGAGISTCQTTINSCTAMTNGNQLSSAPLYGYSSFAPVAAFQPFTPFATQVPNLLSVGMLPKKFLHMTCLN